MAKSKPNAKSKKMIEEEPEIIEDAVEEVADDSPEIIEDAVEEVADDSPEIIEDAVEEVGEEVADEEIVVDEDPTLAVDADMDEEPQIAVDDEPAVEADVNDEVEVAINADDEAEVAVDADDEAEVAVDADDEAEVEVDADVEIDDDAPQSKRPAMASDEEAEVEVDVDDDEPQSKKKAKSDDGDDEDGDDEASMDEAPKPPTPKLTVTTWVLVGLNLVVVIIFAALMANVNATHEQYVQRTAYHFVFAWGLPLASEETATSISVETRPVLRLNAEQLKAAFSGRRTSFSLPGNEPFVAIEEPVPFHLRPSDMTSLLMKDLFADVGGDPVATLDDEIKRLQESLPNTIEAAAKDIVAKTNAANKRGTIKKMLLPIAWDVWQVKRLNDKLAATKDADLDAMLLDSVQRRIYYDILAPINVFRPGAEGDYKIERLAAVDSYSMKFKDGDVNLKGYSIDELKGFLNQRLKAAMADKYDPDVHHGKRWPTDEKSMTRDNNERRQVIGYILFTLGQVQVPTTKESLLPKGLDRAQVVSGLNEFTNASIQFVASQRLLQQRIAEAIRVDREGWILTIKDKGKDEVSRTNGFIDEYEAEVQRLIRIVENIDTAQKRIEDLKGQRDQFTKLHDERAGQQKATMAKLLKARQDTEKYAKELRDLQAQLHTALIELSDAAERNFTLEAQIRGIELDLMGKTKGAK